MSVPVSDAVFQEVQQKVADHQASVNLIQNQLGAAQQSLTEWQSIVADLVPDSAAQAPVADAGGLG